MRNCPGYGDEATWGPCMGHPNDPRTDYSDDYEKDVEDCIDHIRAALKADDADTAVEVGETLLRYADERDIAVFLVGLMQSPDKGLEAAFELANDAIIATAQARVAAGECSSVRE